jgi:hypothetical protein
VPPELGGGKLAQALMRRRRIRGSIGGFAGIAG